MTSVRMDDKNNIGSFIAMAPGELKHIGNIDFVDLNVTDQDHWTVGVKKILEKAVAAGAFPKRCGQRAKVRARRQGGHQKDERSDEGIETGGYAITGNESACGEAAAAPKNAPQALEQAAEDPAQRKRSFRRQLSDHFGFHADDAPLKEASGRDFGRASSSEKHAALEQRRLSSCKSTGTPPQDAVRV